MRRRKQLIRILIVFQNKANKQRMLTFIDDATRSDMFKLFDHLLIGLGTFKGRNDHSTQKLI